MIIMGNDALTNLYAAITPGNKKIFNEIVEGTDPETMLSWVLNWALSVIEITKGELAIKFVPSEIITLKEAITKSGFAPGNPATGEYFLAAIKGDRIVQQQARDMSETERFVLTLEAYIDNVTDRYEDRLYVTPQVFARSLHPRRSTERIVLLCNQGRIPGAFKDAKTGRWRIPRDSVQKVQRKLNPKRRKYYVPKGGK